MIVDYPFTEKEMETASMEWGANCGPSSLAFALQCPLDAVRGKIPGFEELGYTSPTMMRAALQDLGRTFMAMEKRGLPANEWAMFPDYTFALTRVQWCGPWTAPGANPKWAYRHSHWIASWQEMREAGRDGEMRIYNKIFDCNGGIALFEKWKAEIVPLITAAIPRADGRWLPTHVWVLTKATIGAIAGQR